MTCGHWKQHSRNCRASWWQGPHRTTLPSAQGCGRLCRSREELRGYHDELYHGYTEAFGMASCAVSRMKAHWFYLIHLFKGADPLEKPLRKAREGWEYETVVNQIFACWPK